MKQTYAYTLSDILLYFPTIIALLFWESLLGKLKYWSNKALQILENSRYFCVFKPVCISVHLVQVCLRHTLCDRVPLSC